VPTVTADVQAISEYKQVKAESYQLVLPKEWVVDQKGDSLIFKKHDKSIGGLEVVGYYDNLPLPNHSETINTKQLSGYSTEVTKVDLKLTQPAASGDTTAVYVTHIYFLFKAKQIAYDFFVDTKEIDEKLSLAVAKSFTLIEKEKIAVPKLTIKDIEKKYAAENVVNITHYKTDYVLVESRDDVNHYANKFELFNLRTGDADILPTIPNYTKLAEIRSENEFVFFADGTNSEYGGRQFPFIIECRRSYENTGFDGDFSTHIINRYFTVDEAADFGDKENEVIKDIRITLNGIEMLFGPMKENDMGFYAAYTSIPRTKISYISGANQLVVRFAKTDISNAVKKNQREMKEGNYYIKSYQCSKDGEDSIITLNLTPSAKFYTARTDHIYEFKTSGESADMPFLNVVFKAMMEE